MNASKRTVVNVVNYWGHSLTPVFSRSTTPVNRGRIPWSHLSLKRSRTTDAKPGPVTDEAEKPRLSAMDLARKIREKAKAQATPPPLSTQQKRVQDLKRFSTQLQSVHPNVLAKHLHRSVLYRDDDVVVVNKPYGVPVRGTQCIRSPQINIQLLNSSSKLARTTLLNICTFVVFQMTLGSHPSALCFPFSPK